MALGRRDDERQNDLWTPTADLPRAPGHPFYEKLNELLAEAGFDRWVEQRCRAYYAACGRPGIPPGVYFRMLLIGYFEGLDSQRGIAWRCADSTSLKSFLGYKLTDATPDHSSLPNIRKRLPLEMHDEVFAFVLGRHDGRHRAAAPSRPPERRAGPQTRHVAAYRTRDRRVYLALNLPRTRDSGGPFGSTAGKSRDDSRRCRGERSVVVSDAPVKR